MRFLDGAVTAPQRRTELRVIEKIFARSLKSNFNKKSSFPFVTFVTFVTSVTLSDAAQIRRVQYLMGTVCEIEAHGSTQTELEEALSAAFGEIARLEAMLSNWRGDSEISRFNHHPYRRPFALSAELFEALLSAQRQSELTGGAFDVTVEPLTVLWDLRGAGRVPRPQEIARALRSVGHGRMILDETRRTATFTRARMGVDLGGIGKGYALDRAAIVLKEKGIHNALLNFGGQILALGSPPGAKAWRVRVADPFDSRRAAVETFLSNQSLATSSQKERELVSGGRRVGHIIDPKTGRPVEMEGSVTVVAASASEADALSTALLVMGPGKGIQWLERNRQVSAFYLIKEANGQDLKISASRHYPVERLLRLADNITFTRR
ncbi:MAG: FAD:protein FMN transferase [Elusimicrobia bacterium]|nr:FAD:protein FMN transferase [Elusimicrobiota bacterium]